MEQPIKSALISVFYKDGLEPIVRRLQELNVGIYSTGGTQVFLEQLGVKCTSVETVTGYPSILGGRVKTLHPKIFGGILARRGYANDETHVLAYDIPLFDLVIVDLYPFEETLKQTSDERTIIEKIDIGGVSLIRAAAKNFEDVCVVASKKQYPALLEMLERGNGNTSLPERRTFAAVAFAECAHYDIAIADYFNKGTHEPEFRLSVGGRYNLRYGENPHQSAAFYGDINQMFDKLNGKELSYNNLADIDSACRLVAEFENPIFAVIKHTNVCGIAERATLAEAWADALAGDPESAFGGVLATNREVTVDVASKINELFFEVLIAPAFSQDALTLLCSKKNRIILKQKQQMVGDGEYRHILNGVLVQESDNAQYLEWSERGARTSSAAEHADLVFANIVCKHLKSNAIAIVKDKQLIGKGCGQTSRIDALRHAVAKARQMGFDLQGSVFASDAFFPFDDCVKFAHESGMVGVIHPGGSMRDNDSINFCKENGMVMVTTATRHFKH